MLKKRFSYVLSEVLNSTCPLLFSPFYWCRISVSIGHVNSGNTTCKIGQQRLNWHDLLPTITCTLWTLLWLQAQSSHKYNRLGTNNIPSVISNGNHTLNRVVQMLVQTHYRTAHRWLDDGSLQLMQMFVKSWLLQDFTESLAILHQISELSAFLMWKCQGSEPSI